MERRLAAILAADIQGYSRLMGADEAATLSALRDLNATVIGPCCAGNRGKVIKTLGDGWLMSFPSAVDAVNCAMQIQDRIAGHDRFNLRIGIHAGDVIHEADDVFGDGVNIAARLEGECVPGEIIVSDAAFISLDGTLSPSFDAAGERELKNIARPVRVWTRAKPALTVTRPEDSDIAKLVIAPVIASGDDDDIRDVSDALSSDLLSYLGSLQWMRVVLASSESAEDVYVLQSRLRSRGDKLRLESRLHGPDGMQVWTGKYDGAQNDIFDWQDKTGEALAAEVMGMILDLEHNRLKLIPDSDLTAEQHLLISMMKFRALTEQKYHDSVSSLSRAIDLKPDYAQAYGEAITMTLAAQAVGWQSLQPMLDRVPDWVDTGRRLPDQTPLLELAIALYDFGKSRESSPFLNKIGQLLRHSPSDVRLLAWGGWSYNWLSEPQLALDCFEKFRRTGLFDPLLVACEGGMALAYVLAGNDAAAIRAAERGLQITTGYASLQMVLAAAHTRLGHVEEGQRYAREYMAMMPHMTMKIRREATYATSEQGMGFLQALEQSGIPPE